MSQGWSRRAGGLASIAPVFLVMVAVLEVAVPYLPPTSGSPRGFLVGLGRHPEIGGPPLLAGAVSLRRRRTGIQIVVAVLALLGGGAWR